MLSFCYNQKRKDAFWHFAKQKSFQRLSSAALEMPYLSISLPAALTVHFFSIKEKKSVGIVCSLCNGLRNITLFILYKLNEAGKIHFFLVCFDNVICYMAFNSTS